MLDEKVKDDEEKGMENAAEIREEVVKFFKEHEDSGQSNNAPSSPQNNPLLAQSSTESVDSLDQATKFLDSQLLNLGWFHFISVQFSSILSLGSNGKKTVEDQHGGAETKTEEEDSPGEIDVGEIKEDHRPTGTVRRGSAKLFNIYLTT